MVVMQTLLQMCRQITVFEHSPYVFSFSLRCRDNAMGLVLSTSARNINCNASLLDWSERN